MVLIYCPGSRTYIMVFCGFNTHVNRWKIFVLLDENTCQMPNGYDIVRAKNSLRTLNYDTISLQMLCIKLFFTTKLTPPRQLYALNISVWLAGVSAFKLVVQPDINKTN